MDQQVKTNLRNGKPSIIYQPPKGSQNQFPVNSFSRYIMLIVWVVVVIVTLINNLIVFPQADYLYVTATVVLAGFFINLFFSLIHSENQRVLDRILVITGLLETLCITTLVVFSQGFSSIFLPFCFLFPLGQFYRGSRISGLILFAIEILGLWLGQILIDPIGNLTLINLFPKLLVSSGLLGMGYFLEINQKHDLAHDDKGLLEEQKALQAFSLLSEEKSKLEEILQGIQDGVITTDNLGRINLASRKALEILKTSWVVIHDKAIQQILPLPNSNVDHKNSFQVKLTSLDGETIRVNVNIYQLKDNYQQVKGEIYVIRDITGENELEAMKLDFVAMAAHQLRTPLTSIKGYLNLLSESINGSNRLSADESLYLKRSLISADRLAALIENLLNVSRIEKGALKVNLSTLHLDDLVKTVVNNSIDSAKQKNINLILEQLTLPYPEVKGDAHLLSEAISNLIQNGIEYTSPGGWVMVKLQKAPDCLTVHVSDNGKGIPAEAQPYLFRKFFRASNSLTQLSNGIGLGLFITKSIIDAHLGKIWVNSIEGKGSTFSFSIPTIQTPLLKH